MAKIINVTEAMSLRAITSLQEYRHQAEAEKGKAGSSKPVREDKL